LASGVGREVGVPMNDFVESKRTEVAELCRQHRVRLLELFGSAANGRFNADTSDLDFLVEFEAIPRGENARCYFGMLFGLEDLFGRKIDLVDVRAIRNPYFLRSIAKDRVVFYAA
jgi:predicted nucleotidyltransferase